MTDLYQAVQLFLSGFCPNVYHVMFPFRAETAQYAGRIPGITFEFANAAVQAVHSGSSDCRKVALEISFWGDLAEITAMREAVGDALNGKVIHLSGFEFAVVERFAKDVFYPDVDFRRIFVRYEGVVIG